MSLALIQATTARQAPAARIPGLPAVQRILVGSIDGKYRGGAIEQQPGSERRPRPSRRQAGAAPNLDGSQDAERDLLGGTLVAQVVGDLHPQPVDGRRPVLQRESVPLHLVALASQTNRLAERHELQSAGAVVLKRSEEHTSELQSLAYLVCRLLLEKKKGC